MGGGGPPGVVRTCGWGTGGGMPAPHPTPAGRDAGGTPRPPGALASLPALQVAPASSRLAWGGGVGCGGQAAGHQDGKAADGAGGQAAGREVADARGGVLVAPAGMPAFGAAGRAGAAVGAGVGCQRMRPALGSIESAGAEPAGRGARPKKPRQSGEVRDAIEQSSLGAAQRGAVVLC